MIRHRYVAWIEREVRNDIAHPPRGIVSSMTFVVVVDGPKAKNDQEASEWLMWIVESVFPSWELSGFASQVVLPGDPEYRVTEKLGRGKQTRSARWGIR